MRTHLIPAAAAASALALVMTGCTGGEDAASSTTTTTTTSTTTETSSSETVTETAPPTDTVTQTASDTGSTGAAPPATGTATESTSGGEDRVRCTRDATEVTVTQEPGGGGAGHYTLKLTVKNTGTTPCYLKGYPGLQLLKSAKGPALGAPAEREPGESAMVTLIPNGTASTEIQVSQAANHPSCTADRAPMLQVILPDTTDTEAVKLPRTVDACTNADIALLKVKPFPRNR